MVSGIIGSIGMASVFSRHFAAAVLLGLAEVAAGFGLTAALYAPSAAQGFDDRFPFLEERARRRGFSREREGNFPGYYQEGARRGDSENNSKAPPPRKADS